MSDSKKDRKVREALPVSADATVVSAAEFKTHCLQLMDKVQQERGEVVVTKYGRPVAKLVPYEEEPADIFGWLRGTVTYYGDIISPLDEVWDADA
jgi:prevent-host-death family protein